MCGNSGKLFKGSRLSWRKESLFSLFLFLLPRIGMWWLGLQQPFWTIRWPWEWKQCVKEDEAEKQNIKKYMALLCTKICSKNISCIKSFNPHRNPMRQVVYYLHFIDEERKKKGNFFIVSWLEKELKPRPCDSGVHGLSNHLALSGFLIALGRLALHFFNVWEK